jgi:hypothetical protein
MEPSQQKKMKKPRFSTGMLSRVFRELTGFNRRKESSIIKACPPEKGLNSFDIGDIQRCVAVCERMSSCFRQGAQ